MAKEDQTLDMDQAKNMTVGEAVRKDSELKAGITDDDSVLDKYIKQHHQEVVSQKFATKSAEAENLDTASLDNFIKKQREELLQSGALDDDSVASADDWLDVSDQTYKQEEVFIEPEESPLTTSTKETFSHRSLDTSDSFLEKTDCGTKKKSKKKKLWFLFILLLLILGLVFGLTFLRQSNTNSKTSSRQTSQSKSSIASKEAEKADSFNKAYKEFFTDKNQTKLKNDSFDKLDKLEENLQKLKNTSYYEKAKTKFDSLKKQISAIQAVNAKFSSDAIKNGEKVTASVKDNANFDDLKSETLKTGNARLDKLLQTVIDSGRKQVSDKTKLAQEKASQEAQAQAKAEEENKAKEGAVSAATTPAYTSPVAPASPIIYGMSPSTVPGLQRELSRVPYNNALIADQTNPAWAFNPGVLEKIVATSQARGYISGNNYILDPVNIINGNGYYNMFKPDGTYLFSINCKTGYFVGNAKGHADDLDY